MNIFFYLPGISYAPIGGYKIVFEYSNRLSNRGHKITIVFDCENEIKKDYLPEFLRKILCKLRIYIYPKWFPLSKKVFRKAIFDSNDKYISSCDITIATAFQTAKKVAALPNAKENKYYLIQDFENWGVKDAEVYSSYKIGMTNIVISKWLQRIVDLHTKQSAIYIPNGIDFDEFYIQESIENRNNKSLCMLYHKAEHKGTEYGLKAISLLKQKYHDIQVHLFGVPERPENLPEWIEYTSQANPRQLRDIYNHSAIFVCPSIEEGFGLTGAESMACGCALVSTNYKGVAEYAEHGKNSLLSPIKNADALADNVEKLFNDNNLRIKLAISGNKDIQNLSWDNAINLFENLISKI